MRTQGQERKCKRWEVKGKPGYGESAKSNQANEYVLERLLCNKNLTCTNDWGMRAP